MTKNVHLMCRSRIIYNLELSASSDKGLAAACDTPPCSSLPTNITYKEEEYGKSK